ncbi:LOW QUALITY PROTEIN: adenylate-forming reductase 03009-like [Gastrolobium bilobum]|uniref:LOW QUALITY PROTEIN: adenylate-forming reductase 03009-like n=1 Tax=Gastrolobium bilobum TaxID=150636 RepID=UPI002AAFB80E|nr:LOW QUALITY PROTEIN: adenylate-forming reductase 03009-like [Gastrolobium bilobum]
MQSPVRFSSCRGVAFEVKPQADPFAIMLTRPTPQEPSRSFRTSRVFPSSLQRSSSKASSHFCDLDLDEEEEEDDALEIVPKEIYDVEKQKPLTPVLPDQRPTNPARKNNESRLSVILLDQGLFTLYKRLFMVCLTLNVTGLVLAATGNFPYARNRATLFSIGNILALTLCRSEAFLRLVFWLAVKILGRSWVPLLLKTATTSLLQSVGGVHSGCGVSSIAWLVYALVLTLKQRENTSPEIIGVSSAILGLLCLSCLLWAFIMLTISYDPKTKSYSNELGSRLIQSQEFWFTVAITVLIITPWLTVRRVPVKASSASGHASIIKFEGGIKAGILGRISPSPLSEWHAFGIISDGKKEHMMLAGAVGDFTKSLVSNPPTHLWVRQVHFAGLPYLVNMYERVLLVATVREYACFFHFFCSHVKLMSVSGFSKDKVIIHDTAVLGRPNVSELSVNAAKNWDAEVVIVTSNPEGSRDVVNACKAAGIAAFGPIWDS